MKETERTWLRQLVRQLAQEGWGLATLSRAKTDLSEALRGLARLDEAHLIKYGASVTAAGSKKGGIVREEPATVEGFRAGTCDGHSHAVSCLCYRAVRRQVDLGGRNSCRPRGLDFLLPKVSEAPGEAGFRPAACGRNAKLETEAGKPCGNDASDASRGPFSLGRRMRSGWRFAFLRPTKPPIIGACPRRLGTVGGPLSTYSATVQRGPRDLG